MRKVHKISGVLDIGLTYYDWIKNISKCSNTGKKKAFPCLHIQQNKFWSNFGNIK